MEREIKREGEGDGRHVSWMISSSGYITYFSASEYDFFVNMDVYTSVFVVVLNTERERETRASVRMCVCAYVWKKLFATSCGCCVIIG